MPGDPAAAGPAVQNEETDRQPDRPRSATTGDRDRRSARAHAGTFLSELWALARQLYNKAAQDNIFFLSGAIAFNIVVAIVPLILATVGIAGLLLQSRFGASATDQVMRLILQALPPLNDSMILAARNALDELIGGATGFVGVGAIVLIWIATRLVGTLRTALREIFDLQDDRGVVYGKVFDMGMVVAAGTLLAVNVGGTVVLQLVGRYGRALMANPGRFDGYDGLLLNFVSFISVWFMFVLIYRYLPARRIQWRIAMIAATFTAALFEAMKYAFGWYVQNWAVYNSTYGNFATLFIFLLWIYYTSVAIVLGGEVGQVWALRRIRKRQKQRLH